MKIELVSPLLDQAHAAFRVLCVCLNFEILRRLLKRSLLRVASNLVADNHDLASAPDTQYPFVVVPTEHYRSIKIFSCTVLSQSS